MTEHAASGRSVHRWYSLSCCLAGLVALGCGRREYHRPEPVDGVRFFAASSLDPRSDGTLLVRVSAHNRSRRPRRIDAGGSCADGVVVRAIPIGSSTATWDSGAWRRAQAARLAARRDTTPDGRPIQYGTCLLDQLVIELAPGDSAHVASLAVPVREVLGDSLPPGRYRIRARLTGNGWQAGELGAGEVELRPAG